MKIKNFLLLLFCLSTNHGFSQNVYASENIDIQINNFFPTAIPDNIDSLSYSYARIKLTDNGQFFVLGSNYVEEGRPDTEIIKLDEHLNIQWRQTYLNDIFNVRSDIKLQNDEVYVVGSSMPKGKDINDFFLLKIDNEGKKVWYKTYENRGYDACTSIFIYQDNCWLTGRSVNASGPIKPNSFLIRTDLEGNELNRMLIEGDYNTIISSHNFTDKSMALLVLEEEGSYDYRIKLVKVDTELNTLWSKNIGLMGGNDPSSSGYLESTTDGGFMILSRIPYNDRGLQACLTKVTKNGDIQWSKTYGFTDKAGNNSLIDNAYALHKTPQGHFIIGGETWSIRSGERYNFLFEVDENGQLQWANAYAGNAYGTILDIAPGPQKKGYVICGYHQNDLSDRSPFGFILTLDSQGKPIKR